MAEGQGGWIDAALPEKRVFAPGPSLRNREPLNLPHESQHL